MSFRGVKSKKSRSLRSRFTLDSPLQTRTRTHAHTHAHTHTYTDSHTYTLTQTHIHTLTHIVFWTQEYWRMWREQESFKSFAAYLQRKWEKELRHCFPISNEDRKKMMFLCWFKITGCSKRLLFFGKETLDTKTLQKKTLDKKKIGQTICVERTEIRAKREKKF